MRYNEERMLGDFVEKGTDELTPEWHAAAAVSTFNTRLTSEQLAQFVRESMALTEKYLIPFKNQTAPGARPVHVVINAFPVIDGDEMADENRTGKP
jgi:hypothetical protein